MQHGFDRFERGHHLAFHIGDAAGVDVFTANIRGEGAGFPQVQRIDRLDIVVTVNQDGGRVGTGCQHFTVNNRMPGSLEDLHIAGIEAGQLVCHPLGGALDIRLWRSGSVEMEGMEPKSISSARKRERLAWANSMAVVRGSDMGTPNHVIFIINSHRLSFAPGLEL